MIPQSRTFVSEFLIEIIDVKLVANQWFERGIDLTILLRGYLLREQLLQVDRCEPRVKHDLIRVVLGPQSKIGFSVAKLSFSIGKVYLLY
jgi:hypothetical protein